MATNGGESMRGIFGYDSTVVRGLTKIGDCICLSVLWIVFSLPVVTMGAASAALYKAVYHCLHKDEAGLWKKFWESFKENLKRSTLIWLVAMLILAVLTVDVFVFRSIKLSGDAMGNFYWAALIILGVALTWTVYLAAYSAKFNGKVREVLRLSFLLMLYHPIKMLGVFLPLLAGAVLVLLAPFMVFLAPAVVYWISSYSLEKVFLQHMRPEDIAKVTEDSESEESFDDQ